MHDETEPAALPGDVRKILSELQSERDRLKRENAELREERQQLIHALFPLLRDEVDISKDEILREMDKEVPIQEFLKSLRAELTRA